MILQVYFYQLVKLYQQISSVSDHMNKLWPGKNQLLLVIILPGGAWF